MIFPPKLAEWVQVPAVALPNQAKNGREIVGENDETEPAAVDQPCSLEYFIILLGNDTATACFVAWDGVWVLPRSALIDIQELLSDILDGS